MSGSTSENGGYGSGKAGTPVRVTSPSINASASANRDEEERTRLLTLDQDDLEKVGGKGEEDTEKKGMLYCILHPSVWKETLKKADLKLMWYLLALILFGTGNKVALKRMTIPMYNYPYFLSQLTTIIYIPIFAVICAFLRMGCCGMKKSITDDMVKFPKIRFFWMGLMDSIAGVLVVLGVNGINGPMSVLLAQAAIPVTMIASIIFLRVRYKVLQYIGAGIIVGGILVVLIPSLLDSTDTNTPLGLILFFSSNVPTAASSVYKEIAFKGQDMDVMYLNYWVSVFQLLMGLPLSIPSAPLQGSSISDIPRDLYRGLMCWAAGSNFITTGDHPDNCGPALWAVNAYMLLNISYNIFLVTVLKHGSAALMFIASTVVIPLANVCFTFHFIMGDQAKPLQITDIIGLIVIITGLIIFRIVQEGASEGTGIVAVGPAMTEFVQGFHVGEAPLLPTRTAHEIRGAYLSRIGIGPPAPNYGSRVQRKSGLLDGSISSDSDD